MNDSKVIIPSLQDIVKRFINKQYNHKIYNVPELLYNRANNFLWTELNKNLNLLYDAVRDPNTSICFIYNLLTIGKVNVYDIATFYYIQNIFEQNKDKSDVVKYCLDNVIEPYINKSFKSSVYGTIASYDLTKLQFIFTNTDQVITDLFDLNKYKTGYLNTLRIIYKIEPPNEIEKILGFYYVGKPIGFKEATFLNTIVLESYKIINPEIIINNIKIIDAVISYFRHEFEDTYIATVDNPGINLIILLCKFGNEQIADYVYSLLDKTEFTAGSIDKLNHQYSMFFNCLLASNNINLIKKYIDIFADKLEKDPISNPVNTNFTQISHYFDVLMGKFINPDKFTINLDIDDIRFIMSISQLYSIRLMQMISNHNNMLDTNKNKIKFVIILPSNIKYYDKLTQKNINFCNTYDNLVFNYFPKSAKTLENDIKSINEKFNLNIDKSQFKFKTYDFDKWKNNWNY